MSRCALCNALYFSVWQSDQCCGMKKQQQKQKHKYNNNDSNNSNNNSNYVATNNICVSIKTLIMCIIVIGLIMTRNLNLILFIVIVFAIKQCLMSDTNKLSHNYNAYESHCSNNRHKHSDISKR